MAFDHPEAEAREVQEAVRQLLPEFSARAAEGDTLRTMPPDLVHRVKSAGLFRLNLPRSLGGWELDPATTVRIFEEVSRADGSAGWTLMIGNSTAFFAWLNPAVAVAMIAGNADFASTSMFSPGGRATPDSAGFLKLSGRWSFNSGCPHAEWLQVGAFMMDGDRPRLRPDGAPDWRLAFVPRELAEIADTWRPVGLCGTGSHDLTITDRRIPEEHFVAPFFEPARHDGPLWRIPFFTLVGILMAGFPLGVARRALDEFTRLARDKVRGGATETIARDGHAQVQLAHAEGGLQAARAFLFEAIGDVWAAACQGDTPSIDQRSRMLLATTQAMRAGVAAVDAVFHLAGAGAVLSDQPLQRCFRDIHAGGQHAMFSGARDQLFAKLRLGLDVPTYRI